MKLFITEFTHDKKRYAGPTIVAETLQIAEDSAADLNRSSWGTRQFGFSFIRVNVGGRRKQSLALNSELVFVIVLNILFLLGLLGLKFYLKRRAERNMKAYL